MIKLILVGAIIFLIYRFWETKPTAPKNFQEPEEKEYAEYEEIESKIHHP